MSVLKMSDLDLAGKRVFIRQDLNVPLDGNRITSTQRIDASIPTIELALSKGAKVMITSHIGRPEEGVFDEASSLAPVVAYLKTKLSAPVRLVRDYLQGLELADGEVVVLENCRFNKGEKKNNDELGQQYAALCDVFVMDAFGTAHRAQASTHAVAKYATIACAGPLLAAELDALAKAIKNPERPFLAIVGGSKVSTKLTVLENLAQKVDSLIVGGGITNTFILARGNSVGKSLAEPDLVSVAQDLDSKFDILKEVDVRVAKSFSADADATVKLVSEVAEDDLILDIGDATAELFAQKIREAKTIIWNGPVGVFEFDNFSKGTETVARAIAESQAFSVAGGGDTLAAIDKYDLASGISYISTGGGAFLEFVEGKILPAVEILEQRAKA